MIRVLPFSLALVLVSSLCIGAEVPLSTVVYAGAPGIQDAPQAATDGTNFLVVWRDQRFGPGSPMPMFAARVSAEGELLDTPAIAIPNPHEILVNYGYPSVPVVAWAGNVYVVAWHEAELSELRYVRVGRNGEVLDREPRWLGAVGYYVPPVATSVRGGAVVIFGSSENPSATRHAAFFDADGNVKADARLPMTASQSIASDGESIALAWRAPKSSGATVSILLSDGTLGPPHDLGPATNDQFAIESNGDGFVVVLNDDRGRLVSVHLDRSGSPDARNVIDPALVPIGIGRHRSGYVVAARDTAITLDANGSEISRTTAITGTSTAFAANDDETLMAWSDRRLGYAVGPDIFSRIIGGNGDTLVSRAAVEQHTPQIASAPTVSLAVWAERRSGNAMDVRATRIGADGVPLDGEGIKLGTTPFGGKPAVVYDGISFVVAWIDADDWITIERITTDGTLLAVMHDVPPIPWPQFALATNGSETLLAWSGLGSSGPFLRTARIAADGSLPPPYADVTWSEQRPIAQIAVAGASDAWLVTWVRTTDCGSFFCNAQPDRHFVFAARLNRSLFLLDGSPLPAAASGPQDNNPSVASNGRDFLVAWDTYADVRGRTISSDGLMGDEIVVAKGTLPVVASRGNQYVIAWQRGDSVLYANFEPNAQGIVLANAAGEASLASTPSLALLAAYERVATEPVYGTVARAFVQLLPPPLRMRSVRR